MTNSRTNPKEDYRVLVDKDVDYTILRFDAGTSFRASDSGVVFTLPDSSDVDVIGALYSVESTHGTDMVAVYACSVVCSGTDKIYYKRKAFDRIDCRAPGDKVWLSCVDSGYYEVVGFDGNPVLDSVSSVLDLVDTTVRDLDIYVSQADGDDTNDGTELSPYATLIRAMLDVPRRVRHLVHIHLAAGSYDTPDLIGPEEISGDGFLLFDGTAEYKTIVSNCEVDDFIPIYDNVAATVNFSPDGSNLDDYKNKFMLVTSGGDAVGHFYPILGNQQVTTEPEEMIIGNHYAEDPAVADKFSIVEPGVTINVSVGHKLLVRSNVAKPVTSFVTQPSAGIIFAGIKLAPLDDNGSTPEIVIMGNEHARNCVAFFFSIIDASSTLYLRNVFVSSQPSDLYPELDFGEYETSAIFDCEAISLDGSSLGFSQVSGAAPINLFGDSQCVYLAIRSGSLTHEAIYRGATYGGFSSLVMHCYVDVAEVLGGFYLGQGSDAMVDGLFIHNYTSAPGKYGVTCRVGGRLDVSGLEGEDDTSVGLLVGRGARIMSERATNTLTGPVPDSATIVWDDGTALETDYPVIDDVYADGGAAIVVGY